MNPTTPHTQPLPGITCAWFSLIRFRSPLLTESQLFSLPEGTEMFHFPSFPPHPLYIQRRVTPHDWCWVSPFGNPRITARLTAPRGISQPPTSFIGSLRQGIHRAPLDTYNTQNTHQTHNQNGRAPNAHSHASAKRNTTKYAYTETKLQKQKHNTNTQSMCRHRVDARVHYTILKQHTPPHRHRQQPAQTSGSKRRTCPLRHPTVCRRNPRPTKPARATKQNSIVSVFHPII